MPFSKEERNLMAKNDTRAEPVLRLLRCKRTNRYFTGDSWVDDASLAKCFRDQTDAVSTCVQHDLTDIELVLRMPDSQTDLFITGLR